MPRDHRCYPKAPLSSTVYTCVDMGFKEFSVHDFGLHLDPCGGVGVQEGTKGRMETGSVAVKHVRVLALAP